MSPATRLWRAMARDARAAGEQGRSPARPRSSRPRGEHASRFACPLARVHRKSNGHKDRAASLDRRAAERPPFLEQELPTGVRFLRLDVAHVAGGTASPAAVRRLFSRTAGSNSDPLFKFPLWTDNVEDKSQSSECDEDGDERSDTDIQRPCSFAFARWTRLSISSERGLAMLGVDQFHSQIPTAHPVPASGRRGTL